MMIKSLVKSMAIYAAIGTVLLGSGKLLATGIDTMIDTANQMSDAVNYCVTAVVDTDDVKSSVSFQHFVCLIDDHENK